MTDEPSPFPELDPAHDVLLSPSAMRGLVNPLRLRLLDLLQADGPSTATELGRRVGQSTGVTSYHLRVLAEHGFIVEDAERGNDRDRWWRAVHRSTSFSFRVPGDAATEETVDQAVQFVRLNAEESHRRVLAWVDTLSSRVEELPELPWTVSDWPLTLSVEQAREVTAAVRELVSRFRREPGADAGDGVRVHAQFQLFPEP
ncbi:helix-turn-helix domain-containing protein [Leifsonia sp. NPDC056824]|uniref:helix-turn-helix domain-containing protein n=1 Tax=Leifsonia sp. NPDC056824 TaxID=3345953 RepID=UPI0036BCB9A8